MNAVNVFFLVKKQKKLLLICVNTIYNHMCVCPGLSFLVILIEQEMSRKYSIHIEYVVVFTTKYSTRFCVCGYVPLK